MPGKLTDREGSEILALILVVIIVMIPELLRLEVCLRQLPVEERSLIRTELRREMLALLQNRYRHKYDAIEIWRPV